MADLSKELDVASVIDSLASTSSSQTEPSGVQATLSSQAELPGLKTPPNYSPGPTAIPPFDVSLLGLPPKNMDDTLLGLVPRSPVKGSTRLSLAANQPPTPAQFKDQEEEEEEME